MNDIGSQLYSILIFVLKIPTAKILQIKKFILGCSISWQHSVLPHLQFGVTVTWVDQWAGPVGGGARFLRHAITPHTAVMTEMSRRAAHRLTISATSDTPPASCTVLNMTMAHKCTVQGVR